MRVLVVDDETEIVEALADSLESAGHKAFKTMSAQGCLDSLRYHRVDCVITDLRMPRVSGQLLIEILHISHPEIPVMVLSGHIDSRQELYNLGVKKIFSKPTSIESILDGLQEVAA